VQSSLLKEHLIGQEDAVDAVCTALMRARAGLRDPDRPIASLLLVGPTGEYGFMCVRKRDHSSGSRWPVPLFCAAHYQQLGGLLGICMIEQTEMLARLSSLITFFVVLCLFRCWQDRAGQGPS
jgi:hypothetical protein